MLGNSFKYHSVQFSFLFWATDGLSLQRDECNDRESIRTGFTIVFYFKLLNYHYKETSVMIRNRLEDHARWVSVSGS